MQQKYSKTARILAIIGILCILGLIIYMLYCAFTGKNFMASLFLVIMVPIFIWIFLFFSGKLYDQKSDNEEQDNASSK